MATATPPIATIIATAASVVVILKNIAVLIGFKDIVEMDQIAMILIPQVEKGRKKHWLWTFPVSTTTIY